MLELVHPAAVEKELTLAENTSYERTKATICANAECSPSGGAGGNEVKYKLEAKEPLSETYSLSASLLNTHVYIAQEKAPAVSFNESEAVLSNGRVNALMGGTRRMDRPVHE